MQLTSSGRSGVFDVTDWPQWSPDGAHVVFASRPPGGGALDLFVVGASGGAPRRLTEDASNDTAPSWSQDGKSIYFISNRSGTSRVWSMPSQGGPARQLSTTTALIPSPLESPDGQWVYFRSAEGLSRVRAAGGDESDVVKDRVSTAFRPTLRGVFYFSPAVDLQSATLRVVPLSGGEPKDLGTIPHTVVSGVSFSPDFTRMLYARCDQCAADIMLVENFR